jgi:putative transposase
MAFSCNVLGGPTALPSRYSRTAGPEFDKSSKIFFSRRLAIGGEFSGRFWQSRFYDFNLWSQQKEVEKLKYMHRNPVVRGLAAGPEDRRWSSYRSYAHREAGLVRIKDWTWWEEKIRQSAG